MRQVNLNDYVFVQLTPAGRDLLRGIHMHHSPGRKYTARKEDGQGWSKWQLHELMSTFGEHLFLGNPKLPFRVDIMLEDKPS